MNIDKRNTVITFCKYPVEGKVKTRIAKTIGNEFAVKLYKMFAEHTFGVLSKTDSIAPYIFFTEKDDRGKIEKWTRAEFPLELQSGNDLGERMYNAFNKAIERGSVNTIIIGTDIPDISSVIIKRALKALENSDVVIGPSNDGGYYLLGMKKLYKDLFIGIEWSRNSVLRNTIEKLNNLNLSYSMLPELIDIDTEEDLKMWLTDDIGTKTTPLKAKVESSYFTVSKI